MANHKNRNVLPPDNGNPTRVVGMVIRYPPNSTEPDDDTAFSRFRILSKRLLSVPKTELDELRGQVTR